MAGILARFNPVSWWRWWRSLPQNPIYLREKGGWGSPNPFYDTLSRYSPFVVMGAILLGLCTGVSNPGLFTNNSGNDAFFLVWCLLCLPSMLLSMITLFGAFTAPALTAPMVSMEVNRGTWEILRTTPLSTRSILGAKLFGALARLRIWPILFALSLLQGLLIGCSTTIAQENLIYWGWLLGVSAVVRPWVEILFAALIGLYASTRTRSATTALVAAYTAVVLMRVLNSSGVWTLITLARNEGGIGIILSSSLGPTTIYVLATGLVALGIVRRADQLDTHNYG